MKNETREIAGDSEKNSERNSAGGVKAGDGLAVDVGG